MSGLDPVPVRTSTDRRMAAVMAISQDLRRILEGGVWPVLDLIIRLWLAQAFWLSGLVKVANWQGAIQLATYEYPVSWMDPVTAAWVGAAIEILGPVFLVLGLATRYAALPMMVLALVIQFAYIRLDVNLFWALLLGWYVVHGAGPISFDALLVRGIAGTALPLVRPMGALFRALTRFGGPVVFLLMRCWMAWLVFRQGQLVLPAAGALVLPVLLVAGLGTRAVALALLALAAALCASGGDHGVSLYGALMLGLLVLRGPGALALDPLVLERLHRRFPGIDELPAETIAGFPHVVVVGAGFGGVTLVRTLRHAPCRITLIDRRNYHLFQPLLYQVATAALSPSDIAQPIRSLFRDQRNVRVVLGTVTGVDPLAREVVMGQHRIGYDTLVLATGARHDYFGKDQFEPFAPGLKQIDDATDIRRRLLLAFEHAETCSDPEERRGWLTFVVVGGGPTGVELAGAIAELAHHGLAGEFTSFDPASARVLLIQGAPRLLPPFPERLSEITRTCLEGLGVEVWLDSFVEHIDGAGVVLKGQRLACRTVFWAAGVAASPAAHWLKAEADRTGRLKVDATLAVPGLPNIFAIGDTALSLGWNGNPVPGLAPAAKQGGAYVAKVIRARLERDEPPGPFVYRHAGNLATIGRGAAVVDFGRLHLSGALAWWLWGFVHIAFLVDARSRAAVALEWFWAYITFSRSTRLITGETPPPVP
jgi:NADH dehydrogenase FAD-containing subunit/uncharacterized membrane protein YphA (DoxX/SURF4 family)